MAYDWANSSNEEGGAPKHFGDEFEIQKLIEDLTLLLLYLSSWKSSDPVFDPPQSWKGYEFDTLDALSGKGYISGSKRSKSVILTEDGVKEAERLERLFLESTGMKYRRSDADTRIKARTEVEFFCEICQSKIGAPAVYYEPFEQYREGKISWERIIKLLRQYHLKQWHADVEKIYRGRFRHNIQNGMEFIQAAEEARSFAERMVPKKS